MASYLTITALEDNCVISLPASKVDNSHYQFSKDGSNWVNDTITINKNESCYVKGTQVPSKNYDTAGTSQFSISQPVEIGGHITSLFDGDGSSEEIPSTTVRYHFSNLFAFQPVTKIAPGFLNAKILKDRCYYQMFGWTEITETTAHLFPDEISGTGVSWAEHLYCRCNKCKTVVKDTFPSGTYCDNFFAAGLWESQNLEKIEAGFMPENVVLGNRAFYGAFGKCPKLNHVEFDRFFWPTNTAFEIWLTEVAEYGTFYCEADLPIEYGDSRIPTKWTVVKFDKDRCLKFTATADNTVITKPVAHPNGEHYKFSKDGIDWVDDAITLNTGESAYCLGSHLPTQSNQSSTLIKFAFSQPVKISGKLSALYDGGLGKDQPMPNTAYCFSCVFADSKIAEIDPELLNFTTIAPGGYYLLFGGATIPEIPEDLFIPSVTSCGNYAFRQMFAWGGSFTKVPGGLLPDINLSTQACMEMFAYAKDLIEIGEGFFRDVNIGDACFEKTFYQCYTLKKAPKTLPYRSLPARALYSTFANCTALEEAPVLSIESMVAPNEWTFSGATSLNQINVTFKEWPNQPDGLTNWFNNVAPTGAFICPEELPQIFDASHIPFGWVVNPKAGIFYKPSTVFKKEEV